MLLGLSCLTSYQLIVSASTYDNFGIRELSEIFRYPGVLLVILMLCSISKPVLVSYVDATCKLLIVYSIFVFFAILLELPFFHEFFSELYIDTKNSIRPPRIRLAAPFENPNYLGVVSSFTALYFLIISLAKKHYFFWFSSALLVVFLTGSRTAWLIAFLLTAPVVLMNLRAFFSNNSLSILLVAATSLVAVDYLDVALMSRVLVTLKIFEEGLSADANFMGRLAMMGEVIESTGNNFVLGIGINKETFDSIDSQFFKVFSRIGFFGFVFYMVFLVTFLSWISERRNYIFYGSSICIVLMLATGAYFDNFRVFFILICLLRVIFIYTPVRLEKISLKKEKVYG